MSRLEIIWVSITIVSLILYSGTALVVSIGGFFDLVKMFRYLSKIHKEKSSQNE